MKQVVLAKQPNGHQARTRLQSQSHETSPPGQGQVCRARASIERFSGTANDDHDGLARDETVAQALLAWVNESSGKNKLPPDGKVKVE